MGKTRPNLGGICRKLTNFDQVWTKKGHFGTSVGRDLAYAGQHVADFVRSWPIWADGGPNLVEFRPLSGLSLPCTPFPTLNRPLALQGQVFLRHHVFNARMHNSVQKRLMTETKAFCARACQKQERPSLLPINANMRVSFV